VARVERKDSEIAYVETRVIAGGVLSNRKGIAFPDSLIPLSALTPKDQADLDAALALNIDWIALSFVQRPEDVEEVRRQVEGRAFVMAKIEKPQALACINSILAASDGLMVARGDLGVEMPLEHVPGVQRRLIFAANSCGKPVVVATQMLESMIQSPVPTRAEVSDVSTAVFEGADAIMLSAESASGNYPVQAIRTMARIAEETERDILYRNAIDRQRPHPDPTEAGAIAEAARTISTTLNLQAIIAWTSSGATALRLARERPNAKILALAPRLEVARRLTLVWGIQSLVVSQLHPEADIVDHACQLAREAAFIALEERAIVVAGIPFGHLGSTNMLRIAAAMQ
jgi:pyruvate kinase